MTVEELLNRMSSKEIIDWQAYYIIQQKDRETENTRKDMVSDLRNKYSRGIKR